SARSLARAWRLVGRVRCSAGLGNRGGFDWLRHRRINSAAGGILRRRRAETNLWPGLSLRAYRLRVVTRSRWAVWQERERYGFDAAVHGWPRAARFNICERACTQLS